MKKLFITATLACLIFSACSNSSNNSTDTSATAGDSLITDTISTSNADSTKSAAEKMAKDSADAAHGHSH
ncbi:hypothetical protein [Daejeonella sp. JGW-45]|uniref:hypothetical protein n=1 Tax=Daejeonella sp. JGW-45 TaxID=3034148 RepID=UPI0023EDEC1D|nr:hypothetical protein [Daejeonella sp. JGW-45]